MMLNSFRYKFNRLEFKSVSNVSPKRDPVLLKRDPVPPKRDPVPLKPDPINSKLFCTCFGGSNNVEV